MPPRRPRAPSFASAPADQAVRRGAMDDLDTSVFLQAGAGTGKTSVLVGRLVNVVRRGRATLDQIVAITFTEKAAGELRDRVRRELYEALQAADTAEAERLRAALTQVDSAHIETIHAFASSLLRERPLEAGLDPGFSVLDAINDDLAFQRDWEDWLWSEEEGAARPRIERCLRLGLSLDHLRSLAASIGEFRDIDPREAAGPVPTPPAAVAAFRAQLAALAAAAGAVTPAVVEQVARVVDRLEEVAHGPLASMEADLSNLDLPAIRAGRGQNDARIRFLDAWQRFLAAHGTYRDHVRSQALAEFIEIAYVFTQASAAARKRNGVLNFQDLLIEARDLIRDHPAVRRYFRDRFRFLFVDEFQDTDPLQAEIVLLLAAANDTGDWREAPVAPGRLFIVGDPKQSIYRFRRADIDIYADVEARFRTAQTADRRAARVDVLGVNFRSRPDLVEWHNQVFAALIQQPVDYPRAQPSYQRLTPHRHDNGASVIALDPNTGVSWRRLDEARTDEAAAIARLITTVVETDTVPLTIADADAPDGRRAPSYRDVCLLVRNRTNLELYVEALEDAGVPYHLDSGRGFFVRQEVRDAAAILAVLDDPSDEVALLAALKSAPYAASDAELLAYHHAGGRFRLEASARPAAYDGPLRGPLEELLGLRAALRDLPLSAFVDRVLRQTRLLEVQFATRGGARRAANLQIIVQRAADFAATGMDTLRPFVRWLSEQTRADLAEAESPVTEVEDDVVRILTIHQAKGLEFPVVILAKMAGADAPDRAIAVVNRAAGRIDFQVGARGRRFQTPGYEAARRRQEIYEDAEERRLLYVAATRARDWLVIPRFFTERYPGTHRMLDQALPGWLSPDVEVQGPGMAHCHVEHLAHVPRPPAVEVTPDVVALRRTWEAVRREALSAGAARLRLVTPSRLGHDAIKEARETEPPDRSAPAADTAVLTDGGAPLAGADAGDTLLLGGTGADGRARGTLLHDALSLAALDDAAASERRTRRLCGDLNRRDLEEEIVAEVRRTLRHPLLERARAAQRVEMELPLVVVRADKIIEGYVDLAFREPGGWVVVDYKSDREPGAETIAGYEQQVRAYAEMLVATGEVVTEAYLLFTARGTAHTVPLA